MAGEEAALAPQAQRGADAGLFSCISQGDEEQSSQGESPVSPLRSRTGGARADGLAGRNKCKWSLPERPRDEDVPGSDAEAIGGKVNTPFKPRQSNPWRTPDEGEETHPAASDASSEASTDCDCRLGLFERYDSLDSDAEGSSGVPSASVCEQNPDYEREDWDEESGTCETFPYGREDLVNPDAQRNNVPKYEWQEGSPYLPSLRHPAPIAWSFVYSRAEVGQFDDADQ
ncbi:coordinator of PRMT5 and differentiation stimulator isoform X1 [Ascaphus truei]|uniref:coordinator of PRMT5 and differentiation stimulator isoform X1 n=1 Tax=Ascaphus truei TaxID=8439 RepID=UPI003F5A313D